MSYNVLLVDDEPRHLSGLARMLKRLRPDYSVHTARNGKEALHLSGKTWFHLVFTDIQMPVLDGLELIEQLPQSAQPRKVIILSGYDHFPYAQKAIGLGSFDYLLKPFDADRFTAALERAEQSLEKELTALREQEHTAARLQVVFPQYHHFLLNEWLRTKELPLPARRELEQAIPFSGVGRLMVWELDDWAARSEAEKERLRLDCRHAIERSVAACGTCFCFDLVHDTGKLAAVTNAAVDEELLARLSALAGQWMAAGLSVTVGISGGRERESVVQSGADMLQEALLAAGLCFYSGEGGRRVYVFDSVKLRSDAAVPRADTEEALIEALQTTAPEKRLQAADALLEQLLKDGYPQPCQFLQDIRDALVRSFRAVSLDWPGHEELRAALTRRLEAAFLHVQCLEEARHELVGLLERMAEDVQAVKRSRKDAFIQQCLAYIDAHYAEDLSLESVAAVFHFNPSYFSSYFKSKLNVNFSQYITQVRLSRAKELLGQSSEKIYEVAGRLGYRDVKYFNRVFKKEFGITPEEYRDIARSMQRS